MPIQTDPDLHYVNCSTGPDIHRMAYWQWGDAQAEHVVVCVHGLSRQGRDFDTLARVLCAQALAHGKRIRVVCPDVVGRGKSDWLQDPQGYQVPEYAADMLQLLGALQAAAPMVQLDWVGTSMGGLIGLVVCGQPGLPLPVAPRRLVLNDVGPALQWAAIERIGAYLGRSVEFSNVQQAADAMWAISSTFGPHTPAQWLELSRHMVQPVSSAPGAALRLHYDPAIAVPFQQTTQATAEQGELLLWQLYDQIHMPTLLLRGQDSDLLTPETAQAMQQRGPKARLVEFAGVGHAPTLVAADQTAVVADFLLG